MHTCAEKKSFYGKDDKTIIIMEWGGGEGELDPLCITHSKEGRQLMNEQKDKKKN